MDPISLLTKLFLFPPNNCQFIFFQIYFVLKMYLSKKRICPKHFFVQFFLFVQIFIFKLFFPPKYIFVNKTYFCQFFFSLQNNFFDNFFVFLQNNFNFNLTQYSDFWLKNLCFRHFVTFLDHQLSDSPFFFKCMVQR